MSTQTDNDGWLTDTTDSDSNTSKTSQSENQKVANTSNDIDVQNLSHVDGITRFSKKDVPPELVSLTRSRRYRVSNFYQLDNVQRWRKWDILRRNSKTTEKWLFYALPVSMAQAILSDQLVQPYTEFFPRVLGADALYFFSHASYAARVATEFGVVDNGFLVSCRVVLGKIVKVRKGNPGANSPPRGFDGVLAPKGTDLGGGSLPCDMYAIFNPERALMRYVTHFKV